MSSATLAGSKVLVTGASRGIGRSIAEEFVRTGAEVMITGRKLDRLQTAAQYVGGPHGQVIPIVCNQGKESDISELFVEIDERWDRLDVAVINAATNPQMAPLVELDKDAWNKTIQVNLTGAFLTATAAARRMQAQGGGTIIFVSSIAAVDPVPGLGAYSVTKSGINCLAKSLARELGPSGIRVNVVAPGLIDTQFSEKLIQDKKLYSQLINRTPLGRHGQPDEIGGIVVFLASDKARFMTGQIVTADGGMTL